MVMTLHFHYRGCGFNLWSGNEDPTCPAFPTSCEKQNMRNKIKHFVFNINKVDSSPSPFSFVPLSFPSFYSHPEWLCPIPVGWSTDVDSPLCMGWGVGMANAPKHGAGSWQLWGGCFVRGGPAWDVRARENDSDVQMGVEGRVNPSESKGSESNFSPAGSWILNVVQVMNARAWAKWEGYISVRGVPKWNVDLCELRRMFWHPDMAAWHEVLEHKLVEESSAW